MPEIISRYARTGWRGFDRLLKACGHRAGQTILASTSAGSWMSLDPYSYIDRHVLQEGYYESEVFTAISEVLTPGGVLWDIGANIGLHSIATKVNLPDCSVVSFEPSPAILGALWRNVSLNHCDISVFALALSDRDGLATLHIAHDGNPGMTTLDLFPGLAHAYQARATVATMRGDALIQQGLAPQPTVVKIDVEGHEISALLGMRAALNHPDCLRVVFEDQKADTDLKKLLIELGFDIRPLTRNEDTAHGLHNFTANKI